MQARSLMKTAAWLGFDFQEIVPELKLYYKTVADFDGKNNQLMPWETLEATLQDYFNSCLK